MYIIHCDETKCLNCLLCETYFPDLQSSLGDDNIMTMTDKEYSAWQGPLDMARHLCKSEALTYTWKCNG